MSRNASINTLWESAPRSDQRFQAGQVAAYPEPARRYLEHAIAPDTPLATAVRLKMHGEIKLKGWQSFTAEQVIAWQSGMIWQATVWMKGLPILGWDRLSDGEGTMQWKLLGLLPVMKATGRDVTRSVVGRMQGEYVWLPSAFIHDSSQWEMLDKNHISTGVALLDETTQLELVLGSTGQLSEVSFNRWGSPDECAYRYESFGVYVEEEQTFSGYTIPIRIRAGWYFGSDRFDSEGEFFRATIEQAIYR